MSAFQLTLLIIFGVVLVAGVLVFAGYGGFGGNGAVLPQLVMWGTIPNEYVGELINHINSIKQDTIKVTYVQKDPATFDKDFTEAVAEGHAPDLVILSGDEVLSERYKLYPIPFTTLSDRQVKDTFLSESSLFYTSKGYLAVPFTIDPLVMYWNRSLFQAAGLANPPSYWDEFAHLTSYLTLKDQAFNIQKSTIAFGQYQNVTNAKEILSTLIFQAGNPITYLDESDTDHPDRVQVLLNQKLNSDILPAVTAVDFYTQFTDPAKQVFSWNASMPASQTAFLANNLATYFGFASEYLALKNKNPNLDFDVTFLPQPRDATAKITYGKITGLAITKNSQYAGAAFNTIQILTNADSISYLSGLTGLPPVRRDLLSSGSSNDAAHAIFSASALQSQAWLDPNPQETNQIFSSMIQSILTGQARTSEAINTANTEIEQLVR